MVDHQDRMDLWMETPPGVGGSWDRRGTPACPLSPSPARRLMIPTPTANLWHSGWPITNKPCWWKSCKCSAIVWYIHIYLWRYIENRITSNTQNKYFVKLHWFVVLKIKMKINKLFIPWLFLFNPSS